MLTHEKKIGDTLNGLLYELKEECENYSKLMKQLEMNNLTGEQIEDILGELMAAVVSINVHSENAQEEMDNSYIPD